MTDIAVKAQKKEIRKREKHMNNKNRSMNIN